MLPLCESTPKASRSAQISGRGGYKRKDFVAFSSEGQQHHRRGIAFALV